MPPALITHVIAKRSSQIVLFRFRVFAYPVHGRLSQPLPGFLSQLIRAVIAGADRGSFSN